METDEKLENTVPPEEPLKSAPEVDSKPAIHASLLATRNVLVVDEEGPRREETVEMVHKILASAEIKVADTPEQALVEMQKFNYDTYVVNLLMPGYSSSEFVKAVHNHEDHPLLVGFSADKMSDAYDPKKGIKIKPLRKLFERDMASKEEPADEGADEKSS